jgi:DNA-directed RNA polymerase subunit RPC12/RpoP
MSDILEYKCPCCGGAITFDSRIQKMKCPYCDTEFELDTLKEFEEEHMEEDRDPQWDAADVEKEQREMGDEGGTFVSYTCEACGGEIVADQNMAASSCPYCGNPVIVMKKLSGMLKPDLVIPFKLDKKQAEEKLKSHLKGKVLLPRMFRSENRIQEVKGVYVPFWLYDCDAQAEIRCRATRVHSWETQDYHYVETQHFLVSRGGDIGFEKVPVDASIKMDDALMQSIEPFDYSEAVDFQTAYLAGYLADKYDQSSKDCAPSANQRVRQSTVTAFMNTIHGYATCVPEHTDIRLRQGKIRYALLPVWVLNTTYKGKLYTFAMNGQTGKFVGDLPADKGRALQIAGAVFAGVFLLTLLLTGLF